MVKITKLYSAFEAEITINGISFTATRATPIDAFLAVSQDVEFEFGRVIGLGIEKCY
jgi:hypothetical protein